jgi:hypothetical protein
MDELTEFCRESLDPTLRDDVIGPRPTSDYQHLLSSEESHEASRQENPTEESNETGSDSKPA